MRKDPSTLPRVYNVNLSPSLPQRDLQPFARVLWENENNQTFIGLLDTGSEPTLIPGDSKRYGSSSVGVGAYGGQVINGVRSGPSHSGSSGP